MSTLPRTLGIAVALGAVVMLSGCGQKPGERAAGGAGAGAATGATIGAIAGPPGAAVGAAVGAAGGAVGGATTTPQQVNLGKPVWQHPMNVGSAQYNPNGSGTQSTPPPQSSSSQSSTGSSGYQQ